MPSQLNSEPPSPDILCSDCNVIQPIVTLCPWAPASERGGGACGRSSLCSLSPTHISPVLILPVAVGRQRQHTLGNRLLTCCPLRRCAGRLL